MPDNFDVSVAQSLVKVEEAIADDSGTASFAPANTLVLPEDDDVPGDDTELLDPGLPLAASLSF